MCIRDRYLDTPLDAKVEDEDALPPVTADTPEEAREKAGEEKKQGDAHFLGKRHEQACERWGRAIELLKAHGITDVSVAKLYSNRAAAHLALKKHVLAARDGALAVECDAGWWKGHWYFGQATLELVKASAALEAAFAMSSSTLPRIQSMRASSFEVPLAPVIRA